MKALQVLIFLLICLLSLNAQQTTIFTFKTKELLIAQELFEKEKFAAAQQQFVSVIQNSGLNNNSLDRIYAEYYNALCAVELFNTDAEFLLTEFIYQHPDHALVKPAYFHLGRFFYRDKKYKKVIQYLNETDRLVLSEEQQEEYAFKLGYSYFKIEQYEESLPLFKEIKDGSGRYAPAAKYYAGHIYYNRKNYASALDEFNGLLQDESFGPIVPFYISQIYFLQKKYDQVIDFSKPILDSTKNKRSPEISKMIGESYYNTGKYKEAIPYLEKYKEKASSARNREDDYQLGYTYFKTNDFKNAIPNFESASNGTDLLAQNAFYHLGWSYLKDNNKTFARNSFGNAAKLDGDIELKEQALFNFAKTAYELSRDPFTEAIRALQDYIAAFPQSERLDEAYTFLANIYTNTKNYRVAIQSLDKIKNKNENLKQAYQKVAFYRGIELFNDKSFAESIKHFDLSLLYPTNRSLIADAHYWKGDAHYRINQFDESVKAYNDFLFSPKAIDNARFSRTHYDIAYSYLKKKDYTEASIWFRKFLSVNKSGNAKLVADAYMRAADCYMVRRDFSGAIEYYEKGVNAKAADADYGLYQKGMVQGLQQKYDAKIKTMNGLITGYPTSKYIDQAQLEVGRSYQAMGKDDEAFVVYGRIAAQYDGKPTAASAKVQMALIRYNQNKDDEAVVLYKSVIEQYPNTESAIEAALGVKRIFAENGKIVEFDQYSREKGLGSMSKTELDSTAFETAEKAYGKKDNCTQASTLLADYINQFQEGIFINTALYYQMDCALKMNDAEKAYQTAEKIIEGAPNKYVNQSLLIAAAYLRKNNPNKAEQYYKQLEQSSTVAEHLYEARLNLMRLQAKSELFESASAYAEAIINSDKAQETVKNEARLVKAKFQISKGDGDAAIATLRKITGNNSAVAAEGQFLIAEVYHNNGEYSKCEKEALVVVDKMAGYDYWLAKSLILLSDNYLKLGKAYQAKATLKSIIENYDGDDLKTIAQQKLNDIEAQENSTTQPKQNFEAE